MACKLIGNNRILYSRSVYAVNAFVKLLNVSAHFIKNTQGNGNIADIGYIFKNAGTVRKNDRRDYCNNSVFGSADSDLSLKTPAAFYNKLFQNTTLP